MKKSGFVLCMIAMLRISAMAEEGMWIPMLIEQLNIKHMQDLGLRLSAEDIYSINHSSLKDAIVQFGGGCTAEIISSQGLLLTNHHCGLGAIQRLSSLQNDYISNGFWAMTPEEELPASGLTVTMLVRMEDVTSQVLEGVNDQMNQLQRNQVIKQNVEKLEKAVSQGTHYNARIRPFYYGNKYYLSVNETFKDIRLVGAPPASIGKFGGDTDNWMWPRHTGDFSLFRIYVDNENKPAPFSKDNVPYKPKKHIPISLKGYQKNDFTFVFGYPGSTREYLTSYGVERTSEVENPVRTGLRQRKLDIINTAMNEDRQVRIQYTSKAAGIANYWKKMIGETRGIRKIDAIKKKQQYEKRFQDWADAESVRSMRYGGLLAAFKTVYEQALPVNLSSVYISEAGLSIEVVRFAAGFRNLVKISKIKATSPGELSTALEALKKSSSDFFKNYSSPIDQKIMAVMLREMGSEMNRLYLPATFAESNKLVRGDYDGYAVRVFSSSLFTDSVRIKILLNKFKPSMVKTIEKDPVYRLMTQIYDRYEKDIAPLLTRYSGQVDSLQRIYMTAQMEMDPQKVFYPDANSTLRISFGKVDDYSPADAVKYHYFTTLSGVIEKEDPDVYDYYVDPRLKKLHAEKDYGFYADKDGTLHVAFTASNHTTGGNSGSPVLNANGELIGINFDRNWEGTLSDLMYDPSQCRNISLDIRYCLFVIDKVADCKRLIREMEIIQR